MGSAFEQTRTHAEHSRARLRRADSVRLALVVAMVAAGAQLTARAAPTEPVLVRAWREAVPPEHPRDLGVDVIYVVNLDRCPSRWELMQLWAKSVGVTLKRWSAVSYESVDLRHPPMPVVNVPANKRVQAGQVGCTATHLHIWRDAWKQGYNRILVLEDDVVLTEAIMDRLAGYLVELDALAAASKDATWHWLYLRRVALRNTRNEDVFATLKDGRVVSRAQVSWGSAAYVLSRPGIEWLLSHLTFYQHPLDVQISEYQRTRPDFVTLSLCNPGSEFKNQCPENSISFTDDMRKECSFSASQAGGGRASKELPNIWRYDSNDANGITIQY